MRRSLAPVVVGLLAAVLWLPSVSAAGRKTNPFGTMAGVVADARGVPQMGAAIALISADGRILQEVYSNDKGGFLLEHVGPGLYSLRVTLTSFLPALKQNILIEAGERSFLSINLSSLFDVMDTLRGRRTAPETDEDWAWVLRSSAARRPVLRYIPARETQGQLTARDLPEHRTLVQFSGGVGRSSFVGSEADFNTSFTVANNPFQNTSVLLSGNVGIDHQTPAAAFRGVLRREMENGFAPEVSVTLRQIFLPNAFWGRGAGRDDNLQSLTLAASDRFQLAESLRLEYGVLYDSISFLERLNSVNPYGRVIYQATDSSSVQVYYTEGSPRLRLPGGDPLRQMASQLAVYPRLSMRNGSPTVQRGRHAEASVQHKLSDHTVVQAAMYRDDINNMTLNSVAGGGMVMDDFFPDLFTQQYSFNSGNYHTTGLRAAVQQNFSDRVQATFAYSYAGVLQPERNVLYTDSPEELRSILKMQRRHALTAKLAADVPVTRTRFFAAYKWVLGRPVLAGDIYDESIAQAEPNLNIVVRQPLPFLVVLPGKVEALADVRNVLAQGYVPIITPDGKRRLTLVQNYRSFRGGLSFSF